MISAESPGLSLAINALTTLSALPGSTYSSPTFILVSGSMVTPPFIIDLFSLRKDILSLNLAAASMMILYPTEYFLLNGIDVNPELNIFGYEEPSAEVIWE